MLSFALLHCAKLRLPMAATNKILLIVLSLFLPPIAVFLKRGAGKDLIINIVLCLVFFLPGVVHALWLVTK